MTHWHSFFSTKYCFFKKGFFFGPLGILILTLKRGTNQLYDPRRDRFGNADGFKKTMSMFALTLFQLGGVKLPPLNKRPTGIGLRRHWHSFFSPKSVFFKSGHFFDPLAFLIFCLKHGTNQLYEPRRDRFGNADGFEKTMSIFRLNPIPGGVGQNCPTPIYPHPE